MTDITETTRLVIATILNESLEEDMAVDELSQRIEGLYDGTYGGEMI